MRITTFDEFKDLAQRGTFVPVHKEIVADLLTPVSAFLKIAEHSDYAFLLESVEGGEHVGRYSFLGKDPFLILRSREGKTIVDRAGQTSESDTPFMATLRELMASFHSPFVPGLPRFTGGAVGYLGYDAAAWFEPIELQPASEAEDEGGFMLFDTVLAFDHVRHRILIIANARITGDEDLESLYQFACAKIEFVERELDRPLSKPQCPDKAPIDVTSNVTRDDFEQVVRAEHVMLVDLGRNDVGRVSAYGTVKVPTYMSLERYSHVMHLVSIVEGKLADEYDRLDALVACFPAGTVSGAPKVRAMEIISELENRRRGVYAGAVGYLDFAGNLDFCITIRTVVIEHGRAYVQAGAGIVADSNPAAEYEETRDKARAVIRALELAQAGL